MARGQRRVINPISALYKLHSKVDTDLGLIRELETTTAAVHDSQINLSKEGEVVYRDRGYQGAVSNGYSATMKRGARDHPLSIRDTLRNRRISKKRAPGERHYAVFKRVFHATQVSVTTVPRVSYRQKRGKNSAKGHDEQKFQRYPLKNRCLSKTSIIYSTSVTFTFQYYTFDILNLRHF